MNGMLKVLRFVHMSRIEVFFFFWIQVSCPEQK